MRSHERDEEHDNAHIGEDIQASIDDESDSTGMSASQPPEFVCHQKDIQ